MTIRDIIDLCRNNNVNITISISSGDPITVKVRRGDKWIVQDIYANDNINSIDYAVQMAINEMIEDINC